MTTFYEPDVTQYPDNFQAIKCPGLEALTGADMVISFLQPNPLTGQVVSPVDSLESHIKGHSLFVQIKIGYDITSFDQLHSAIARMQACKIPKGQAILLPIGEYYEKDDLLRVIGKKVYGNPPVKFSTLETIYDMWSMRGGTVEPLPPKHIDNLQKWIDRKHYAIDKITKEGAKNIYPPSQDFLPDDIWQVVEEIDDWRKFLVSGLSGFGSAKANAIYNYARENLDGSALGFYQILCLMTDEIKGKPVHKIPLWGDKSRKDFRQQLGISINLFDTAWEATYFQGWQGAIEGFTERIKKEKSLSPQKLQEIFDELKTENEIPF